MLSDGIQAVFNVLNNNDALMTNLNASAGNFTAGSSTATSIPTDISSLIAFVLSLGALRDWFKFFLLGGLIESARRLVTSLYYQLWEAFLLTVEIDGDDPAYEWMHLWLSKQERWTKARTVELSSRRQTSRHGYSEELPAGKQISLAPTIGSTHTLWYKHRLMRVTRTKQQLGDGIVERALVIK